MLIRQIHFLCSAPRVLPVVLLCCALGLVTASCSQSYKTSRLIDDLKETDENTRWKAAKALGESRDLRAVEPLIAALNDSSIYVRRRVEESLGILKDLRAIGPLVEALKKDPDGNAARILAEYGVPVVAPLILALKQPGPIDTPDQFYPQVRKTLAGIGAPAVEPLIAALKDSDIRNNAASILGMIKDSRAVLPLAAGLADPDFYYRREVAFALGEIKDPQAVAPLMTALLQEKSADILDALGQALGKIDVQALDPLISALNSGDRMTKGRAAMALGTSKDPRVAAILNDALKRHDLVVIAGAYFYFHKQGGAPNSVLIEALNAHGGTDMAEYFMNSRDVELEKAASDWAGRKGYIMIPTFR